DPNGVPLVPQPSTDPLDPLNFPHRKKIAILAQVSLASFFAYFSASLIVAAFVPLSESLHVDLISAAHVDSAFAITVGIAPLLFNPISSVYGRRPLFVVSLFGSALTSMFSGVASNDPALLAARAVNGIFAAVPIGLGSAVVCDLFFKHERGRYMGLYSVSYLVGDHIAHTVGGYVATVEGWQWCFYLPGFVTAGMAVLYWFTVPETIYHRDVPNPFPDSKNEKHRLSTSSASFTPHPTNRLTYTSFLKPFALLAHPCITIPTILYALTAAFGATLFIVSSAELFEERYRFDPDDTGLLLGIPLTVGSLLGELPAGRFSDWISASRARSRGSVSKPEDRLLAIIPGAVLVPLGIALEGIALQYEWSYMITGIGIAIASMGTQIVTTVVFAYTAE
ncbi:MFS general substrate transporter, partial [Aulographum hederae CBS 113979]